MGCVYCKRMSAHPQRVKLGRKRLRQKVERAANRRVHGDFRITWRFDRRVDDQLAPEPLGERAGATPPYLGHLRRHAKDRASNADHDTA